MTPQEELEMLRAKKARLAELEAKASGEWREVPGAQVAAPDLNSPAPTEPQPTMTENFKKFGSDAVQGAYGQGAKAALGISGLLPESVQNFGNNVDRFFGKEPLTKENAPQIPDTPGGRTGAFATEVGLTAGPGAALLKGANALRGTLAARGLAGTGTAAAVGADIAGNAGVAAAMEPEDRGTAAGWGAAGTAAGQALTRTLGGMFRKSVSPEAKKLMDADIKITPGQALTGPDAGLIARTLRAAEDKSTSIPLVGDVIKNAQLKSLASFNVHKINEAIKTTGAKVKNSGIKGLDEADELVSDMYTKNLPHINVDPNKGLTEIISGVQAAKSHPLFDAEHAKKLDKFVDVRIMPLLASGKPIDGELFKKLDRELGEWGRKYKAGGVGNEPLSDGFYELRKAWRTAAEGTTPEARQAIRDADQAFAKLVPLLKAGEKTTHGEFTPKQLANALRNEKLKPDDITKAAQYVLPNSIPDSGTAGRNLFEKFITPQAAGAGTVAGLGLKGMLPAAAAAGGLAALYTKPGLKAATQGVHPLVTALRKKAGKQELDPDLLEAYINNLTGRSVTAAGTE
jgi:hypothetical protein